MSNTRHIDLAKLAEQLTGARVGHEDAPATARSSFPRVTAERVNELLGDADESASVYVHGGGGGGRMRLVLPIHATHVKSRPQAQATDGTATP